MNNPLLDNEFLEKLHNYRQRETYARITLLTNDELPLELIEGRVTGGSVNVDGTSALRRTCNLTMILANKTEINNFNWTFKRKFKLEIGLKNFIDDQYPEIIWFKQGTFILTTCNMSQSTNNYTITINGKDKMCLLNGDIGGVFPFSIDLGTEEFLDKNTNSIPITNIPIKDIIRNIVQYHGGELPENIIINDLDEMGLELLEYRYEDAPLYLFRNESNEVTQVTLNAEHPVYLEGGDLNTPINVSDETIIYATTSNLVDSDEASFTKILLDPASNDVYTILKLEYGDLSGYRMTDLTYAGELKANVGETFVSVLDRIKNMLGNFEYFYNLDGRFVFQRKKTYASTPWGGNEQNSEEDDSADVSTIIQDSYPLINLTDAKLVTSFANNPNLLNVKNDFVVWGTYTSTSGGSVPIHMRYALDTKPTYYKAIRSIWTRDENSTAVGNDEYLYYKGIGALKEDETVNGKTYSYMEKAFTTDKNDQDNIVVDWREIIYQMAKDWRAKTYNTVDLIDLNGFHSEQQIANDNFQFEVAAANPNHYPLGITGYEQYYTDIEGFWRQLYNPMPTDGYDEISASEATDLYEEESENLCVASYYKPLDLSVLKDEDETDETKKYLKPYSLSELYVTETIEVKVTDNTGTATTVDKLTFYPFIGSKSCCLEEDEKYSYYDGTKWKTTDNKDILNAHDLSTIKNEDGNELIVNIRYQSLIDNYEAEDSPRLWIKKNEVIEFNELDDECKKIFLGGKDDDSACNQYIINWVIKDNYGTYSTDQETKDKINYLERGKTKDYDPVTHWNYAVKNDPSSLYFWFDFLETEGSDIYKYSVKEIGARTKAINDSDVKSIYYRDVPQIIFLYNLAETLDKQPGYTFIYLPMAYQSLFSISGKGKSAKEKIDELLDTHSYCIETTNITTVPLYNLEPNTRISVRDEMSNVDGEYSITKITIPLAYNGTMSLSATKVIPNIM